MASADKVPMLEEGFRKLEAELQRLKEERPLIVDAIEEARRMVTFPKMRNITPPRNVRVRLKRRSRISRTNWPVRRSSIPRHCPAIG